MGAKVLSLLDNFLQIITSKIDPRLKRTVLITLTALLEQIQFSGPSQAPETSDPQATQVLWERVSKIYAAAELMLKKERYSDMAALLMA